MNEQTIALVTGGNRGIGRAVVAGLADRGMTVVLGSRDRSRGVDAAAELGVESVELDVTSDDSIAAAAKELDERFGRLDVLVNNAGISGGFAAQPPGAVDLVAYREVFATNVFGVIAVTDALLPLLRRSAAPRVVNVSSGLASMARMSDPDGGLAALPPFAAYAPSKSAVNSLTVQYAKALRAEGVLVNAADPGACDTDFTRDIPGITRTADEGAAIIVKLATLPPDGPTGGYFNDSGPVPW
ncbi:SDR family oxidoreductase [Actinokineospora auranticolor]|uniref:NAD(P)-dependent dehydrogenase (Short-subunit alcohol dehydrogenase family) n=1 Tax=Actinokineospora auranticolor TaxID=155976 RepID=A0A2S6GT78_9PSEU|nr:SDR family oxidoreductase [Actinokineospora auranticolor]PPK68321.1 NAD(P)-dependent dehydrogenase (short-subunit alcohol dehydrogenase family) [Actinokineospora auranticolor]